VLVFFSHSDMIRGSQTLECQAVSSSPMGAGGRIADALSASGKRVASYAIGSDSSIWPKGIDTNRQIIGNGGNIRFAEYPSWRTMIDEVTDQRYGNVYAEEFARSFKETMRDTERLGKTLAGVTLDTNWGGNSGLKTSLKEVSKLMKTRKERNVDRDFFFTSLNGWDMHNNMKIGINNKFNEMDEAFQAFAKEMKAQNLWKNVVLITHSEFARTLDSNGGGSDHGWGGQQIMFGGSVNGGQVFNTYPDDMSAGSYLDLGRGRLIPEYPWESMMDPIASWMGVTKAQKSTVFPNYNNFNATLLNRNVPIFREPVMV